MHRFFYKKMSALLMCTFFVTTVMGTENTLYKTKISVHDPAAQRYRKVRTNSRVMHDTIREAGLQEDKPKPESWSEWGSKYMTQAIISIVVSQVAAPIIVPLVRSISNTIYYHIWGELDPQTQYENGRKLYFANKNKELENQLDLQKQDHENGQQKIALNNLTIQKEKISTIKTLLSTISDPKRKEELQNKLNEYADKLLSDKK